MLEPSSSPSPSTSNAREGNGDRVHRLSSLQHSPEEIERKSRAIRVRALDGSRYLQSANFTKISAKDLRRLFEMYDAEFFDGILREMLRADCDERIAFRLSPRMTSAAGKTTRWRKRKQEPDCLREWLEFEIAISTTLLFGNFGEDRRASIVAGIECQDRLEALQRIFEHELIHLAEMLGWGSSSCSQPNFHAMSKRIFGHNAFQHQLATPRQTAAQRHNVHVGGRVEFVFEGRRYSGIVRRITKRASVLVEDPAGALYSDGRRYRTFYVPPSMLEATGESAAGPPAPSG
jgi:hypothetical protein